MAWFLRNAHENVQEMSATRFTVSLKSEDLSEDIFFSNLPFWDYDLPVVIWSWSLDQLTARSIIGELRFFFAWRGLNGCLGRLGHACRVLLGRGNHLP